MWGEIGNHRVIFATCSCPFVVLNSLKRCCVQTFQSVSFELIQSSGKVGQALLTLDLKSDS